MRTPTLFRRAAMAGLATAALVASAQGLKDIPFLQKAPAAATPEETGKLMKAPLNTEKPKGALIFGAVYDDFDLVRNFATFYANEPSKLNKIKGIYKPNPESFIYEQLFGLIAGCQGGDGYYYGYRLKLYSLGITYCEDWVKVNPNNGDITSLKDYDLNLTSTSALPFVYDMSYNRTDGKFYGITYDYENTEDIALSEIGTIDRKTGEYKKLCCLNRYYYAIAFDYDGNLYGVTWEYRAAADGTMKISGARLDRFNDKFEVEKSSKLLVNDNAFIPYYQHSLEFDYTTGDLYWQAVNSANERYIVRVNPEDGKTENLGRTGYNELVLGMYVPYLTADSRTAPARVNGLTYAFDPEGANKTTLTWTNPTTQWNREALADLVEVNIYRDDMKSAPVGTVAAAGQVGKEMSWTDETAERGLHKYYVVPSSVKGQAGIMDSISAFVGRDLPGSPVNVKASTNDGKTITLRWSAPNRGDSDGWFDKESLTYTVTRNQDGKVVAQDIKERTVTDKDIPEATTYTYSIVAKNTEGEGEPAVSEGVLAGQTVKIPFYTDFPDEVEAGRFQAIDNNGDGRRFAYDWNNNKAPYYSFKIDLSNTNNDDYLVSPPLGVKEGQAYRVTYTVSVGRYGNQAEAWTQDVKIVGGMNPTVDGLEETYADYPEFVFDSMYDRKNVTAEFVADHTGEHYVAFNVYTNADDIMWMYLEEFLIEEIKDNDLRADLLDCPGLISNVEDKETPNVYKVTVSNPGKNTQKDYKVQVGFKSVTGDFMLVSETSQVSALEHNASDVVVLNGAPEDVEAGNYNLVARVVLEGDEDDTNDDSPAVAVKVDANPALNYKVAQGEILEGTRHPACFYAPNSASQTIYNPEMLGLVMPDGKEAVINRLVWEYESDKDIAGSDFTVYLGQSNTKNVQSGSSDWIVVNQTKVFEGKVDITKGHGWLDVVLDEGFEFDPEMSLVVTVLKYNPNESGSFPVHFKSFDVEQRHPDYFHSMGYAGSQAFVLADFGSYETFAYAPAPVLYLSVPGATGVAEGVDVVADGEISFEQGQILFAGIDVREASVWSVDGKLVSKGAVANGRLSLDVLPGIYVVKATAADGNVYTAKISVVR